MAEVYAGFLSHADHQLGRLLDYLEESGELDNTLIVLVSDNGASGEGGPNGSVNENKFFNGIPDTIEENLKQLDELGSTRTYNHYPTGWAWAFNTPFKMWKRYSNYRGGTADPLIVSWPSRIARPGEIRRQYTHAVDIVPTIYECLGIEPPDEVNGYTQKPIEGVSFAYSLDDADAPTRKETQFFSMLGTRAIWHRGWKAATAVPAAPDSWGDFHQQRWELFDTDADPSESHDLAEQHPDKLQELIALWWAEAGAHQALPLESGTAIEILGAERPQLVGAAHPVHVLPRRGRGSGVRGSEHPQPLLHDRSRARRRDRRGRRRDLLPGLAVRRPRPLRQRRQTEVRLQLGGRAHPDDRGRRCASHRARRRLGLVRKAGRRDADTGDVDAAHSRGASRRRTDHDAARQIRPGRRRPRRRPVRRGARHRRLHRVTTVAIRRWNDPARGRSTSAAMPSSTSHERRRPPSHTSNSS